VVVTLNEPSDIHLALIDCTAQLVGMFPTPANDATVAPFMNQIAVSPRAMLSKDPS